MEEKKCCDFEIMKLIGLLLVICGHAAVFYTPDGAFPVDGQSSPLQYICYFIYTFHMPLFMFASGGIYGFLKQRGRYQRFTPFLTKKFKRLLIPYLAFGMLLVYPVIYWLELTSLQPLEYFIQGLLLKKDARHLWFLYTLLQIFVMNWMLEWCIHRLPGLSRIPVWLRVAVLACLSLWNAELPFAAQTAQYFFYFYLGKHFLGFRHTISKRLAGKGAVVATISCVVVHAVLCGCYLYWRQMGGGAEGIAKNLLQMFFALFGISVAYLVSLSLSRWYAFCSSGIMAVLTRNLFAIYLFHAMIIYVFFYLIAPYPVNPILAAAGACAAGIIVSWMLGALLRKCKLGFLLGEAT